MPELTCPEGQLLSHVLVVDDEPEILQMVAICLKKFGLRVTCAENVPDARRLLQNDTVDVVVSDVMMPGEDGIDFLAWIHKTNPEIPVILMTGHAQLQMAVNAIKNGAFDFINKPFDFELLRRIVERAIKMTKLHRMEQNYRAELEETVAKRTAELRESMAELDFARTALQQAATEKSMFMSTVSHEMRTPMNGVVGSLELLQEEGITGAAAEYLAMARQSADNMMALINQLLSFNTLNAAGGDSPHDLVDLRALVQSIIATQLPLFTRKGLTLGFRVADDIPRQIWVGKDKLCRLFEILLGNALKFTSQGGAFLDVSRINSEAEGEKVLCSISDSGIGIPEGMLERIFEPFVQGDSSLTRRYEGVGLGLAIARQNILLLNGQIWAENVPSGGSRFNVVFKLITP